MNPALVFLGGGTGAVLRFAVGRAVLLLGWAPPIATLLINVVGSLAMGLATGWFLSRGTDEPYRLFIATGLLGGFTTFSAFSLDALTLWQRGATGQAAAYAAGSVILSLVAVSIGFAVAR